MVERAYLHLMFRTSQAKFRWWLTVDRPKATLDMIPGPYKVTSAAAGTFEGFTGLSLLSMCCLHF